MDGADLVSLLFDLFREAEACVEDMPRLGSELAEAERDYRVEKRKLILYERSKGTPVSIVGDVAKGHPDIARLACARDCAQSVYDANRESIMLKKKKIDMIREIIAREWSQAGWRQ